MINKTPKKTSTRTEYTGVTFVQRFKKYRATVTDKGQIYRCGLFLTPREAAMARDLTIVKLRLNPKRLQILKSVQHEQDTPIL